MAVENHMIMNVVNMVMNQSMGSESQAAHHLHLSSSSSSSDYNFSTSINDSHRAMSSEGGAAATVAAAAADASGIPGFALIENLSRINYSYYYYDYWEDEGDRRISKMPLMEGGPWRLYALMSAYLIFVLWLGPLYMKNRQPYNLKPMMRAYNFFMVLYNAYLFVNGCRYLDFGLKCWGCDEAVKPFRSEAIGIVWLAFVSRLFDLIDTVFFVLRKKQSHVSFLHVFHHTLTPIVFWHGMKFTFYPVCIFPIFINVFIHCVMFTYYGLATFGPAVQKHLWWKKYLTKMQIIQFIIILIHGLQPMVLRDCPYPFLTRIQSAGSAFFIFLFVSFYINAYIRGNRCPGMGPSKSEANGIANGSNKHSITDQNSNGHIKPE